MKKNLGSLEQLSEYPGKDLEAMAFAVNYHRWILSEIHCYLGYAVAEVGAGSGNFSKILLESGIGHLTAFEPSRRMYMALEKEIGTDHRVSLVNDAFSSSTSESFDSVLYVNVLEHIESDARELKIAGKALRDGGHLVIFVPAIPWLFSDLDREVGHFRRYKKRELMGRVKQAGLSIVKVKYFDIVGIIPWYISFVLLKNRLGSGSVALYDKWIVPVMCAVEKVLEPPIGKNLLLVAKR